MPGVKLGEKAEMRLMSGATFDRHVETISSDIYDHDSPQSCDLPADVNPTYNWVRLAQRVPVRIHIDKVAENTQLVAWLARTVVIKPGK